MNNAAYCTHFIERKRTKYTKKWPPCLQKKFDNTKGKSLKKINRVSYGISPIKDICSKNGCVLCILLCTSMSGIYCT